MEVILIQKVPNLGKLGDTVKVRAGYGRNYLIPTGRAVPATAVNQAAFEAKRAEYEKLAALQLGAADARQQSINGQAVTIAANASTEGKLYGSVTEREIAEALTVAGYPVEKREVVLGDLNIRHTGEYEVRVHLHAEIEATVKVVVVAADAS